MMKKRLILLSLLCFQVQATEPQIEPKPIETVQNDTTKYEKMDVFTLAIENIEKGVLKREVYSPKSHEEGLTKIYHLKVDPNIQVKIRYPSQIEKESLKEIWTNITLSYGKGLFHYISFSNYSRIKIDGYEHLKYDGMKKKPISLRTRLEEAVNFVMKEEAQNLSNFGELPEPPYNMPVRTLSNILEKGLEE